jgi:hypothetical protein
MDLYFWKWTLGEPYYKSARPEKQVEKSVDEYDTQLNAISQSLADPVSDSVFGSSISGNFGSSEYNKREELDNRVSSRELVQQTNANPFLTAQSSYVNDIVVRDMFLKPINTSHDKIKNTEESNNNSNSQ